MTEQVQNGGTSDGAGQAQAGAAANNGATGAAASAGQAQGGAPAQNGTILGAGGAADGQQQQTQVNATWPEKWRDEIATALKPNDAKFRERLDRFASPIEIARSYLAAEQKLSTGEQKPVGPPKDATPEQIGAWRKENGVPEKPENYSTELPGGLKFDDSAKPVLDKFLKAAHAKNYSQERVTEGLMEMHQLQTDQAAQLTEFDNENRTKGMDALRAEYGPDYQRNLNVAENFISTMPEDLRGDFLNGRLHNGQLIGADPRFIRWAVSQGMEYPSLTPGGAEAVKGAESRLAEIRNIAKTDPDRYDNDKALQTEQQTLIARLGQGKSRAA